MECASLVETGWSVTIKNICIFTKEFLHSFWPKRLQKVKSIKFTVRIWKGIIYFCNLWKSPNVPTALHKGRFLEGTKLGKVNLQKLLGMHSSENPDHETFLHTFLNSCRKVKFLCVSPKKFTASCFFHTQFAAFGNTYSAIFLICHLLQQVRKQYRHSL